MKDALCHFLGERGSWGAVELQVSNCPASPSYSRLISSLLSNDGRRVKCIQLQSRIYARLKFTAFSYKIRADRDLYLM